MLIQPILFPPKKLINEPGLFFQSIDAQNITEDKVFIPAGSVLSLGTYFNAFSIGKWLEYTDLDNLSLALDINGDVEIEAYHATGYVNYPLLQGGIGRNTEEEYIQIVNSQGYSFKQQKVPFSFSRSGDKTILNFDELYTEGILFITIKAITDTTLYGGHYFSDIDEAKLNSVKIAIGICTFKREEAVIGNVNRILNEIINNPESPLKDNLEVYIADNGQTLDANSFKSDKVHLFPNPNLGGSGGFTRTMIEAMIHDKAKDFTHIIFMDDDILLYTAVLERTLYLLQLLKEKYKKAILGAGMFMLEIQWLQQELGALYKDEDKAPGKANHKFFDLRKTGAVAANEVINPTNYTGWWYACIPASIINTQNFPLPFFIHYDDVEYGLRNLDNNQIFINGICVWHPAPVGKNPLWITYYDIRNRLITMFSRNLCKEDFKESLSKINKLFFLKIISYDYGNAELIIAAIQDFIKGPEAFISRDALLLHKELLPKKNTYISLDKVGINEDKIVNKRFGNLKKAVLIQTLCNLLPAKDKIRAISMRYYNIPYTAKKLFVYNDKIKEGFINERNQKKHLKLLYSFLKVQIKLRYNYKNLLKNWQDARPTLTGLSFWERYLGIEHKD